MRTLVIAEHDDGKLKNPTLNTISAASEIGGEIDVLVAGHNVSQVAGAASRLNGVSKVHLADAPHFAGNLAENVAAQVFSIANTNAYSHILFAATSAGKNVAPRIAARLDTAQISDVIEIVSADTFRRPIYAGNAIATVRSRDAIKVLTIRTTAFGACNIKMEAAPTEIPDAVPDSGLSRFIGGEVATSDRPDLTGAKVVVSGGRGLGSADNFAILNPLAVKLGAALGASRAAVDSGFAPNDWQVGQTGKVVAPELYIAVGISGAIQHLAGMKDSKVIVAINKDADAPIFSIADYGLVGDLFDVVPALSRGL
ncbi:electron transfer flavoprotein subunit beta [Burkholderia sp. Leaf177]|uniref:electron transfer flavoprotein subunit alpha/FixB family protein n=1 Tax=Burkholderia sp. Leaf177 TaxID=1736287 RepID=UPI0006FD5640|nr:FAD-binding protein [Burkholderia sp. Leaf177]KQR81683.1 electron transfer flavoprotein subunit beta [Burkholderia sp. Leaf177]